jgi:hypothetical protein
MRVYPDGHTEGGLAALKSRPLPDIAPSLPPDLRASSEEVLVLIQQSRFTYSGVGYGGRAGDVAGTSVTARFMKGNELPSLSQTITLDSGSGVVFFIPLMVTGIPLGGASTYERLERLCAVVPDGRVVMLYPDAAPHQQFLTTARKDAIVATLRVRGSDPFASIDGPCGVHGTVEWPAELRAQVTDFLLRLPTSPPVEQARQSVHDDLLAATIRNARTAGDPSGLNDRVAMLLLSVTWRGSPMAEHPLFVPAEDFDRFNKTKGSFDTAGIIKLLPTFGAASFDPSNVSVRFICLISVDGQVIARLPTDFEGPARPLGAKDVALSAMRWGTAAASHFPCDLPSTLNWSDADHAAAMEFIDSVREPTGHHVASEIGAASLPAKSSIPSEAGAMALAVTHSDQSTLVVVPLLLASRDVTAIAKTIRTNAPGEFLAALSKVAEGLGLTLEDDPSVDYVCIVGSDGTMLVFESADAQGWKPPTYLTASALSLQDAIAAIDDRSNYRGSFVCSLEQSVKWPADISANVVGFFERARDRQQTQGKAMSP